MPAAQNTKSNSVRNSRLCIAVACIASVAFCFAYAATRANWGNDWYRSHGGGVPYVVFWILFVGLLLPSRRDCLRICVAVVLATCGLEFLQLWDPEPLQSFRKTRFGAALLGSTFVWGDIPPYFLGGAIGATVLWLLGVETNTEVRNRHS